jgi:heat shock protein HtpX
MILFSYRARKVSKNEFPRLHAIISELSKKAGIPKPTIYVIPSQTPNAFATGRNPNHAAVAVTEGIMSILSEDELKGVMAHELTHIKNRDTLISTIAAAIAGIISYVAFMARWAAVFGGFGRDRDDSSGLELLFLAILTPIIATILQLAISRSREFLADEGAARMMKTGKHLASALEKLENASKRLPMRFGSKTASSLFIVNPFRGSALLELFSTHPSTGKRIKRLKEMSF